MNEINSRLEKMLSNDIKDSSINIEKIIKSEMVYVLRNYLIISNEDVDLEIKVNGNGKIEMSMSATARGIKRLKGIN